MKLIRKGKVKDVYAVDAQELLFRFTDNISAFDKIIPTQIPHKGEILCRTSAFWFQKLNENKIKNHFMKCTGSEMFVKRFEIRDKIGPNAENFLIPLEFITRYYVAGSLYERIKKGRVNFRGLGFKSMPEYGAKLPEPIFEITTKFEKYDRKVNFEEARQIGGLSKEEVDNIREIVFKVDRIIADEISQRGLIHVDGKKELAFGTGREIYVVDTFGTMDEDRWWDKKEYENNKIVQLSKEFVRQYYHEIGYYDTLMNDREKGVNEPEIPPLPAEMVTRVMHLYEIMYRRITGLEFNNSL